MDFKKEFQKRIASEFDLNTVISRSLLVEKQKDFSDQKRIDSQPENSLSGDGWCWMKH